MADASIDLAGIWEFMPPAEAERVLRAPKLAVAYPEPRPGTFQATVAWMGLGALRRALHRDYPTKAEWKKVKNHFIGLGRAIDSLMFVVDRPPTVPEDWFDAMSAWVQAKRPVVRRGPKTAEFEPIVYRNLLSLYTVLYDRAPAHTADGPTELFVAAFFDAVRAGGRRVQWLEEAPELHRPDPAKAVRSPTPGTLRYWIRRTGNELDLPLVRSVIRDVAEALA